MARAGRKDRGLLSKPDSAGKPGKRVKLLWYVRLYHEGRERRFGSFPNKTKAREFYEKAKLEQKEGRFFPERYQIRNRPKPVLVREYFATWQANQSIKGKKPSTVKAYRLRITKHVLPTFGESQLSSVTRPRLKAWLAELSGQGLDYDTVLNSLLTFSNLLGEAVEDGLIKENPALRAGKLFKRPKSLEEGEELEIFTPEEELAFLMAVKEHQPLFYPMALTVFRTGIRAGELLGLHRADIDFTRGVIHIRRNWTRGRLSSPKNGKARKVDMSQSLASGLQEWMELQDLEAQANQTGTPEVLFPGNLGGTRQERTYMAENFFRYKLWFPMIEKAGIRRLGPHAARHTFASRLIANGENLKYIAEQLGHSSINVTVDTYGHLLPGGNKRAVDRLDEAMATLVLSRTVTGTVTTEGGESLSL